MDQRENRKMWLKRLADSKTVFERIIIASDENCTFQVLEIMIRQDCEESVVMAAANNKNCPPEFKEVALSRFPPDIKKDLPPSMCAIPWTHIGIQQNGDYRMCCQMIGNPKGKLNSENGYLNINNTTISDARNHEVYKKIRIQMLNGEKPVECNLCFKEESVGLNSKRKGMFLKYDVSGYKELTNIDGSIDTEKFPLKYIDIRFGNLCNLKCRYCGPSDSSLWYEDFVEYNEVKSFNYYGSKTYDLKLVNQKWTIDSMDFEWYEGEKFWKNISQLLPYIDRYYFTGGEPTINKVHFNLLQLIIDSGYSHGTTLEYNSNMVAIPEKLYEMWSHFKKVEIGCSLDGYKEYANYLRYPSKWEDLEKNMDRLGNAGDNIVGGVATTISIYNILNFLELSKWLLNKNYKNLHKLPTYHILIGPSPMSITVLPIETKQFIKEEYDKFYDYLETLHGNTVSEHYKKSYSGIINYMMSEDNSRLLPNLKIMTRKLDKIRNQQIDDVIPWLADILQ